MVATQVSRPEGGGSTAGCGEYRRGEVWWSAVGEAAGEGAVVWSAV